MFFREFRQHSPSPYARGRPPDWEELDSGGAEATKQVLRGRFNFKELGMPTKFLSWEISQNSNGNVLWIHQTNYASKLVEQFGMGSMRIAWTPMVDTKDLHLDHGPQTETECTMVKELPYCKAIGSLMWLAKGT